MYQVGVQDSFISLVIIMYSYIKVPRGNPFAYNLYVVLAALRIFLTLASSYRKEPKKEVASFMSSS